MWQKGHGSAHEPLSITTSMLVEVSYTVAPVQLKFALLWLSCDMCAAWEKFDDIDGWF